MKSGFALFGMALWSVLVGCGSGGSSTAVVDGVTTTADGMTTFIKAGSYKSWKAEAKSHDDGNDHGRVRVFFNDKLATSLGANNTTHPKGAMVVKEIFNDTGDLTGHAMMIKLKDGSGASSWAFFEGDAPDYKTPEYGVGMEECANCHQAGKDFIQSPLPK